MLKRVELYADFNRCFGIRFPAGVVRQIFLILWAFMATKVLELLLQVAPLLLLSATFSLFAKFHQFD